MEPAPLLPEKAPTSRRLEYWLAGALVLTGIVVYLNSFPAEFVWDDTHDIIATAASRTSGLPSSRPGVAGRIVPSSIFPSP